MRLVVSEFVSLDGVVQAPGGTDEDPEGGFAHGGWSMPYFHAETMGSFIDTAVAGTDALLFGRRTWETMAAHWPDRDDGSDPFATMMNSITKYVVSDTVADAHHIWSNSEVIAGDPVVAVAGLKERDGGDLALMGSSQLTRTLIAADLVDEYRLLIEPLLLGGGKSVFPTDGQLRPLELVSSSASPTGVLLCVYRPGHMPRTPDLEG